MGSDSSYVQRLWGNVPFSQDEVSLSEALPGIRFPFPHTLELRRWGSVYRPLDFQTDIIDGLRRELSAGPVTGLIALPTGSGKTRTAAWLGLQTMAELDEQEGTLIWIAPQKELVNQAADAAQAAWWSGQGPDSLDIRVVRASRGFRLDSRPTCLFLTPGMARAVMRHLVDRPVRVAIFDEAHHAAARVFSSVWQSLLWEAKPQLSIGLSATPSRRDPREDSALREAFGGVVYCSGSLGVQPVRSLIRRRVLSKPTFRLMGNVPKYARFKGPEDRRTLKQLVTDPDRWREVVHCIAEQERGSIVVYALDRAHGRALTHHLRNIGVPAEYLDGETPLGLRLGILERFRNGQTRVLVNVALLIEGVDCPAADALVLTYPVRYQARLQQMVGRVLRGPAVGGTEQCRVWALEGSQDQLDDTLFSTRYRYRGWSVESLFRNEAARHK